MITTEDIKKLRDATGVSVMQCKKALEEAKGDEEKAIILLRKKSADIAAKKSDRTSHAGAIGSYVHSNGTVGAMVILSSETDFVANNEEFKRLAYDIAMHITASSPAYKSSADIPKEELKNAEGAFAGEVKDKPKAMQAKILEGKVAAYFKDKTLIEQAYIKNPELSINDLIQGAIQKFGEKIEIVSFVRLSV